MKKSEFRELKACNCLSGLCWSLYSICIEYSKSIKRNCLDRYRPEQAEGETQDIQQGIPYMEIFAVHADDYSNTRDCDPIIITAGRNRRPSETRNNMIQDK